jgi:indolepyruvate ferredoxin oxidoreductase beta subunit
VDVRVVNIVVAGLGGQGVLTASDILADAAFRGGYDVKKAEVHGMSQRGGSVTSDVRFGRRVYSPMVPVGEADYLLVLEPTQFEPSRHYLGADGVVIAPDQVDADSLPNRRSLNVALLGVLSTYLDIAEGTWLGALSARLSERVVEPNRQAFQLGRASTSK